MTSPLKAQEFKSFLVNNLWFTWTVINLKGIKPYQVSKSYVVLVLIAKMFYLAQCSILLDFNHVVLNSFQPSTQKKTKTRAPDKRKLLNITLNQFYSMFKEFKTTLSLS